MIPESRRLELSPRHPAFVQDPYGAYATIHRRGGLLWWAEYGHWCAFDHRTVSALLRDRRFGREVLHVATREQLGWEEVPAHLKPFYDVDGSTMLEREPPVHTRLRGLVNRAFVSRQIERLRPEIEALAHRLIDAVEAGRRMELIEQFATPIPVAVIAGLLGVPVAEAPRLLDWSHRMVAMYRFGRTRADEDAAVAATAEFVRFLRDLLAERRAVPGEDLISTLLAARDGSDRLSEDELVGTCILLLNAGHEATVHAIGNGMLSWLRSERDPAACFADPARTEATVEEMLRHDTPLHLFTRYALEPLMLPDGAGGEARFAVGDRIGLVLGAANRDPAVFAEPDRFDPDRERRPHASFGGGIHFCIGAPLARLEMQVALPILVRRLPGLRLAEEPRFADSFHFRGLERLELEWGS
ncbi:cytochrome P450 [Rhizosaccharibacter radicis]|uniref:Cytochrome P450 n=1 Tax=Rhizosaccharibacter radicis TaxID=2782605 RepID=A0ABT1VUJ3_9PROT|nr:cytochrome P450 [Acetobacteraceae bacterium KSS12]